MNTRHVSFAGSTVAVTYEGTAAAGVLEFLFGHLPTAAGQPHLTFHLASGNTGDIWQLRQEDT